MSDVKNDDIVHPEVVVPEIILVDDVKEKDTKEEVVAAVEAPVVAEADGTEPEEADKEADDSAPNANVQKDNEETEHKNGEATPKENGDTNGTTKDIEVEVKRKSGGGDEPIEPVVEGVSPEKKLKLAESESTEIKDDVVIVEANGEPAEVSS